MRTLLKQILHLLEGLFAVAKHVLKPAVTLEYPEKRFVLPEKFRGKQALKGCVGCGVCKQVCPANAIRFVKEGDLVTSYKIDLNKCIFCGNCQYYCPFNAIKHSDSYELASDNKADMLMELVSEKENEEC